MVDGCTSTGVHPAANADAAHPLRVCLFTDTLGDVNGVSRFIQNVAACAQATGRDLRVVTSTRLAVPRRSNVHNFAPLMARRMPGYDQLEVVLPPARAMWRSVREMRPDVIHISTPGPVGVVGNIAARLLGVPRVGVYHTDFPAYLDHLFGDDAFTWVTRCFLRRFYAGFGRVLTRSEEYAHPLERIGVARERLRTLRAGIALDQFGPRFRDVRVWARHGVPHDDIKVLYVGRLSVEKNLPMLARAWERVDAALAARGGARARLIVVGDGPFRAQMERALPDAVFLGFRHGEELATLYASSDLFVFPSVTDTLGQVVMESQASGLPVLVSDRGGPKEVVIHERTGLVLPADNIDAWVSAMVRLVCDESERRAMGAAAHAAMQDYSIHASFEAYWRLHEECGLATRRG